MPQVYLLVGLTYAYLYPVIAALTNQPFFAQTATPGAVDYVYFSYVTLTTVGFGDFTAATSVGRMIAVSEALTGQLYLVSAVALLVGNIGRTMVRGTRRTDIEIGGEGPEADPGSTHFDKFLRLFRERRAVDAHAGSPAFVRNQADDPKTGISGPASITDPKTLAWARLGNLRYQMLLVGLCGDAQVRVELGDVTRRGLPGGSGIEDVWRTWLTARVANLNLFGARPCGGVGRELGAPVRAQDCLAVNGQTDHRQKEGAFREAPFSFRCRSGARVVRHGARELLSRRFPSRKSSHVSVITAA